MTPDLAPRQLPRLTQELPGVGGIVRERLEDFVVEEVPAYLPSGAGEHLYLWIEKRDLSTADAARLLGRALGVPERSIGYAGQKDRRAVTRQWLSLHLPGKTIPSERFPQDDQRLRVLEASRHGNKLRTGHLEGNRFELTLRRLDVDLEEAVQRAGAVVAALERDGLPNFFGEQRFGRDADNALLGAGLLGLCDHPALRKARGDRHLKRLALSALQSELFNRCLAERLGDGTWRRAEDGDVLRRRESGGLFVSADPATDQARLDSGELDVTGPLPGWRERPQAAGRAQAREDAVLAAAGVPRESLARGGDETLGARRPYRVPLAEAKVAPSGSEALILSFFLPAGSFATRVLDEVMKSAAAGNATQGE